MTSTQQIGRGAPANPHSVSEPQVSASEQQQAQSAAKVQATSDPILEKSDAEDEGRRSLNNRCEDASVELNPESTDAQDPPADFQVDENTELDEEEKKKKELEENKAKMKKQQWFNLAASMGVVAMAVIGAFATSFAIAALVVGTTALELSVTVIVGGAAFAGAGLTLYFALIRPGWTEKMKVLEENE